MSVKLKSPCPLILGIRIKITTNVKNFTNAPHGLSPNPSPLPTPGPTVIPTIHKSLVKENNDSKPKPNSHKPLNAHSNQPFLSFSYRINTTAVLEVIEWHTIE